MSRHGEIGKIYDTIFYCILYFDPKLLEERFSFPDSILSAAAEYFQIIKRNVSALPAILLPLFSLHCQTTPMSHFFSNYIDFEKDTIDSFLAKIKENADALRKDTAEVFFGEDLDTVPSSEAFIHALGSSELSDDLKLQTALLFGNFPYALTLLGQHFREIYTQVDTLHHEHRGEIEEARTLLYTPQGIQLYKDSFDPAPAELPEAGDLAVSLLNPVLVLSLQKDGQSGLLVGTRITDAWQLEKKHRRTGLQQLLISLGNETRLSILQAFSEDEEFTATMIAKKLGLPMATVTRHVNNLFESDIIYISRKSGLKVFFKINREWLAEAFQQINGKLEKTGGQNE